MPSSDGLRLELVQLDSEMHCFMVCVNNLTFQVVGDTEPLGECIAHILAHNTQCESSAGDASSARRVFERPPNNVSDISIVVLPSSFYREGRVLFPVSLLALPSGIVDACLKLSAPTRKGYTDLKILQDFPLHLQTTSEAWDTHSFRFKFRTEDDQVEKKTTQLFAELTVTKHDLNSARNSVRRFDEVVERNDVVLGDLGGVRDTQLIVHMLQKGVFINGSLFTYFGCSGGGLRDQVCCLVRGDEAHITELLDQCGSFLPATVAKLHSRIALLFTPGYKVDIEPTVVDIPDVEREPFVFTDGCGFISRSTAVKISKEIGIPFVPSVFQIRLQGFKGVVQLCGPQADLPPGNGDDTLWVRPSMRKFKSTRFPKLLVKEWSKPLQYANLNKQFIMLLSALGVPQATFLAMQQEYLRLLSTMLVSKAAAVQVLLWNGQVEDAEAVCRCSSLSCCPKEVRDELRATQRKKMEKISKPSLMVVQSRALFGICDPTNTLEYGECYIAVTSEPSHLQPTNQPASATATQHQVLRGPVVVCKNPSYACGDVRVLKAVGKCRGLSHLVDCIVFPVKGSRPHADEITGSDLDGDMFSVFWDERLIPPTLDAPSSFPSFSSARQLNNIPFVERVRYFSKQRFGSQLLGKLNSNYLLWASSNALEGARCDQCQQIVGLFARAVDAAKTGEVVQVPSNLICPEVSSPQGVWVELERIATEAKQISGTDLPPVDDQDEQDSLIDTMLFGDEAVTDFNRLDLLMKTAKKFQPSWQWVLDFTNMSEKEKEKATREFGVPYSVARNGILSSHVISSEAVQALELDREDWKLCLRKSGGELVFSDVCHLISRHRYSLIVMGLDDDVSLCLSFVGEVPFGDATRLPTVYSQFFSPHFDIARRYVGAEHEELMVDVQEGSIRVYRKTGMTFVKFASYPTDSTTKKPASMGRGPRSHKPTGPDLDARAADYPSSASRLAVSVDLQKFQVRRETNHPLITKQEVRMVEVYSLSARRSFYNVQDTSPDFIPPTVIDPSKVLTPHTPGDLEQMKAHLAELQAAIDGQPESFSPSMLPKITRCLVRLRGGYVREVVKNTDSATEDHLPELGAHVMRGGKKNKTSNNSRAGAKEIIEDACKRLFTNVDSNSAEFLPDKIWSAVSLVCLRMLPQAALALRDAANVSDLCAQSFLKFVLNNWSGLLILDHTYPELLDGLLAACEATIIENETKSESTIVAMSTQFGLYFGHLAVLLVKELLLEHRELEKKGLAFTARPYFSGKPSAQCSSAAQINGEPEVQESPQLLCWKVTGGPRFNIGDHFAIFLDDPALPYSVGKWQNCIGVARIQSTSPDLEAQLISTSHDDMMNDSELPLLIKQCCLNQRGTFQIVPLGNISCFSRTLASFAECLSTMTSGKTSPSTVVSRIVQGQMSCDGEALLSEIDTTDVMQLVAAISKRWLSVVHGPPGTGKSYVITQLVLHLLMTSEEPPKILVCAETNFAIDNLTRTIANAMGGDGGCKRILRVGNEERLPQDMIEFSLRGKLEAIHDSGTAKVRRAHFDNHVNKFTKRFVQEADLVLTTITGAGDSILKSTTFDWVIVDEATQAKRTSMWIPLTKGCQHAVFVGDDKQLPAYSPLRDLQHTFFSEVPDVQRAFLTTQRRMHPALAEFPSQKFYDGKIRSGVTADERRLSGVRWESADVPILFLDAPGPEKYQNSSVVNEAECVVIESVVKLFTQGFGLHETKITVLTCYSAQCALLRKFVPMIECSTVDAFQGRENDVIIVSLVRTANIGFCSDERRVNVLLTRAKRGLLVVGCEALLKSCPLWASWLCKAPRTLNIRCCECKTGGSSGSEVVCAEYYCPSCWARYLKKP